MIEPNNGTIWAFNTPWHTYVDRLSASVKAGISRFGWSKSETTDLRSLKQKPWSEMTPAEKEALQCNFLLRIQPGDWIVHVNIPSYGQCIAVPVIGDYTFDDSGQWDDYRHQIPVDGKRAIQFDRNDPRVHPLVSRSLKLRRRQQRVLAQNEFFTSLDRLMNNPLKDTDISKELYYLIKDLDVPLQSITKLIHDTHAEKKLEYLVADVFRAIPQVTKVQVNGSGWGTDYGADVIVTYTSGLPIEGLEQPESVLVVQVKSFKGEHWETNALQQVKTAILKYHASAGLLITTGKKTERLEQALVDLAADTEIEGKPISIIAGSDVARFMLRHAGNLFLGQR